MPQSIHSVFQNHPLQDKITALGYETLEELAGAAQAAGEELSRYLGTDVVDLINSLPTAAQAATDAELEILSSGVYELGALIEQVGPPVRAFDIGGDEQSHAFTAPTAPPTNVNLIPNLPPIRNQQSRGTCVAFATVAALEHYLIISQNPQDMSEQFLYWNCKKNDGIPNSPGTWLAVSYPLLKADGTCREQTWPYVGTPIPGNEGQGPAPAGAAFEALSYKIPQFKQLPPTSVADIKAELLRDRCVSFSVPVFNSWYQNTAVKLSGNIIMPIPNEIRNGGHAMCIVGFEDLPQRTELGGGRFILRNSWGANWGVNSPYGAGYGTIPYAYISKFGSEAFSIV